MSEDITLSWGLRIENITVFFIHDGTPPDYDDSIVGIRSPNGVKPITGERLAEITEKAKNQRHFDRLIEEEVARVV
jgi:hypothetical protein